MFGPNRAYRAAPIQLTQLPLPNRPMRAFLILILPFLLGQASAIAMPIPPSNEITTPAKDTATKEPTSQDAIGTAYENSTHSSPVWFVVRRGTIASVNYPTLDRPQLGELEFVVTDGKTFFSAQGRDTESRVRYRDEGLVVEITGKDKFDRYSFQQEIFTDINSPVIRIRTSLKGLAPGFRVFVVFKPAIQGTREENIGETTSAGLFATSITPTSGNPIYAALLSSTPWMRTAAQEEDVSWTYRRMGALWSEASPFTTARDLSESGDLGESGPGKVVLSAELQSSHTSTFSFELALAFGESRTKARDRARASLSIPIERGESLYTRGWKSYLDKLGTGSGKPVFIQTSIFARRSAQIVKMHEDKNEPGRILPYIPVLSSSATASEDSKNFSGYRVRDAYYSAQGLLAAGDRQTPIDILQYLIRTQRENGSWTTETASLVAMDEIALPILLASQLQTRGLLRTRGLKFLPVFEMIRRSTNYLLSHGPTTDLDRWESIGGYVPSTLAVVTAALRRASKMTGDPGCASAADQWQSMIETWTLEVNGPLGQNYYSRAHFDRQPNSEPSPNSGPTLTPTTGTGPLQASELIDGGFLELVRLGVRDPQDIRVINTLRIYDNPSSGLSEGLHYRRFTLDTQGPSHRATTWPVLAGERGMYAVAAQDFERARAELHAFEASANENGLLPEQAQAGLDSKAYAWVRAHAENLLLHRSLEEGSVFDQPPSH